MWPLFFIYLSCSSLSLLSFPGEDCHCAHVVHFVLKVSQALFSFLHSLFSVCSSDSLILVDLSSSSWILSSACSGLLLNPFSEHFHFSYCVLLNSRISIRSLKNNFYLFLKSLYFMRHHSYFYFSSLDMVSFSPLNVSKTGDLKSLFSKSNIWASLRIYWLLVSPYVWAIPF